MATLLLAIIYLCFISLGLPDSLLGSAWPTIYQELHLPTSYLAYVSMTISFCTIIASLSSDRLVRKFGSGPFNVFSIFLTVIGLLGFSFASQYWMFFLCAIPYGLGGGGIDASLNNYVASHYKARHMSWLHCMWGIGAFISPNIMSFALTHRGWHQGYFITFIIQAIICLFIFLSLPLWKKMEDKDKHQEEKEEDIPHLGIVGVFKLKGTLLIFISFFCYCAIEMTCFQWGATYLVIKNQISEDLAANLVSFLYLGMALGRLVSGFLTMKFKDHTLIRMGIVVIFIFAFILIFQNNYVLAVVCFAFIGFGAGPIYPSIVHSTPALFGKKNSQAIIGVQMAFAYLANLTIPAFFGVFVDHVGVWFLPFFILIFLVLLFTLYEIAMKVRNKAKNEHPEQIR